MKILHIINDESSPLSEAVRDAQSAEHEITVIELAKKDVSYDEVVDAIFANDKVVSW